jgi:hypothetical protein
MLSCWLVSSGLWKTAEEALHFFAYIRTEDEKGVTIPSQRRWVTYFEQILKTPVPVKTATIKRITLHTFPKLEDKYVASTLQVRVSVNGVELWTSDAKEYSPLQQMQYMTFNLPNQTVRKSGS